MNELGLRLVWSRAGEEERPKMTCPSPEELTLLAEARSRAELGDPAIAAHIRDCTDCREEVRREEELLRELAALPNHGLATPMPSQAFFDELQQQTLAAVQAQLEERAEQEGVVSLTAARWRRRAAARLAVAAAAAACILLMLSPSEDPRLTDELAAIDPAEVELLEDLLDTGLFAPELQEWEDEALEEALLAEMTVPDMPGREDSLPLLEGLAPGDLSDEQLSELLDDWEVRG